MDKEKIKNYIYRLEIKIGLYFLAQCDEAKEEYRVRKYKSEYETWISNYETDKQVIPELECLMMLKVTV